MYLDKEQGMVKNTRLMYLDQEQGMVKRVLVMRQQHCGTPCQTM